MTLTIDDAETQTYVFEVTTEEPTEGSPINVTLRADPAHVDDSAVLTLHSDDPEYNHDQNAAVTVNASTAPAGAAIVVTPPGNDGNRVEDSFTLTAHSGSVGNSVEVVSVTINVADINVLPTVAAMVVDDDGNALDPQPTSVKEGESVMVAVMSVDEDGDALDTTEAIDIALTSTGTADAADYSLVGSFIIVNGRNTSNSLELQAHADEDVGMESLMFDATVSGEMEKGAGTSTSAGVLSLSIDDDTTKKIEPKATDADDQVIQDAIAAGAGDDGLNPGEMVTLMMSDLFDVMTGYTATYGAYESVDSDVVSVSTSGEMVTISAENAGEAEVTITGTATMSSSSLTPAQTVSNFASLTFPVTVNLTTLTVEVAAEATEIMEGGSTMITATASRNVAESDGDVTINLDVVGDATLDADSITIAAGAMSGSVMLTAAEDDDYADGSVTVVATGSGIDGTMQVAIAVTDNDEAPVDPEPANTIEPKSQDEAYPVITGAIEAAAGDEGLNPGESFSVMASALFTVAEGYTATYGVSVDSDSDAATASVSGDSVTVMAAGAGEANVTITGTSRMASSSFTPDQVATNLADITFPVMVVDKALVVTLEMPANVMNGNIVEGASYDIVASANRAVTAAEGSVEVMIMGDRAASDAGDGDYSVDNATIMAGNDSATATLMVTEDMEPDSGTNDNMGESLVLFGKVNGEEINSLTFTIWDQAVPTLPLIGQLLLALFLMLGGARLYRRRQG